MRLRGSSRAARAACIWCATSRTACSPSRAAEFSRPLPALLGTSLWRYASPEIVRMEAALDPLGWHDRAGPPSVEFDTGANASRVVPIRGSRCRWTRMALSDGSAVRLVETLDAH